MRLLSPVDKVEEVEEIIKAGANELYCGVLTSEWHDKYIAGSINRRPGGGANFTSFDELRICVEIAHSYNIPVLLALNEHYYTQKQYPLILDFVEKAINIGIDALMVADLAFLLTLQQININAKIFISTGGTAFNSETVRFYQDLGASRIILPRHLTLEEIRSIRQSVPNIELEVFVLNSRCPNVDGFCTFQHGLADESFEPLYKNACTLPYEISVATNGEIVEQKQVSWERQHIWELVHPDDHPCGACALYEFNEMGITGVKIVGRGNPTTRKITDVVFIRSLLDFLQDKKPTKEEFKEVAQKLYANTYKRQCRICMCYYPSLSV
jgi:putative protease